ncbi:MAG: polyprenyl synthetase family protein [Methylophilaceae bacterium]|jgi:geranylgeranyl diphosphate synthase type I|nr:polyprenyl synthetase family protein [Methylophilaceae bacterium]MBL6728401.1 polyprenyl synthetase family protein [Methylophilaceae bacterium]MBL6791387.1 polyprenyl synthetase family protein [Methylophilaceae bacterium]
MKLSQIGYSEFFMPPEADEFLYQVKNEFAASLLVDDSFLSQWLKHHGESQGKWIRARLALSSGALLGLSAQTYIKWAVVCELIHSASLLHDDICDNDALRRGRITVWKEFGIPAAICTGDFLIAESFRKLTEIEQGWHQTILLKLLSCSVKDIIFGQSFDVSVDSKRISWPEYKKIAINKTAPLILLPMMGMFKCKEYVGDECEALEEIANQFGLAYQWLNDIENIIGIEQEEYSDLLKNHPNAVLIRMYEDSKLQKKSNEDLKKLINQQVILENLKEVNLLLGKLMLKVHRLPIMIQPIIVTIKNELTNRIKKYEKN